MSTKSRVFPETEARRRRVAAGLLAGKSQAVIAREEDVSRQAICKLASSEDVRQLVVAVVNAELDKILGAFQRALQVIFEAFEARVIRVRKDGEPVDLGPDHYARLAAVGCLIKVMTAGRPTPKGPKPGKDDGTMTLAELEAQVGEDAEEGTSGGSLQAAAHAALSRGR